MLSVADLLSYVSKWNVRQKEKKGNESSIYNRYLIVLCRMEANQEIESTKTLLSGMEQDKLDLESQLQRLQAQNTEQREKVNNGGCN